MSLNGGGYFRQLLPRLSQKTISVLVKKAESWPAFINYKLQSCPGPSQGESKDEDEESGCRCILFAIGNGDIRAVFIHVLFSACLIAEAPRVGPGDHLD